MKKILALFFLTVVPATGLAAGGAACGMVQCDAVDIDLSDEESLQNGARIFVNFCLSCHSAAYMRYNRMGQDLGISDELVEENLLFAADKVGDLMKAVMPMDDAKVWFGTAPPDLTLTARSRSPEWIYTYLRSFYRDETSFSGWNNAVFEHVAMPHVLYEWQGEQRALFRFEKSTITVEQDDGTKVEKDIETKVFDGFEISKAGTMTEARYDAAIRDLTNFMVYLAEPAKLVRYRVGIVVLLFLIVLFIAAYLMKKEYWKDVH